MVWKLFQAPMVAQYTCCDEPSVTEDYGSSFSDLSVDSDDLNAQPDPFSEEATFPSDTFSEEATFPPQHMVQHPLPLAKATGIQEAPSTPDTDDELKIAKGGITPRTRPPLRTNLSRRRLRTHAPLRVNTSVEATTLGESRQKHGPSKDQQALPMLPDSHQVPTRREHIRKLSPPHTKGRRDDSPVKTEQAKEATVGLRRRQCTRPVLNSRSYTMQSRSAKTMTPTPEQLLEHKKMSSLRRHSCASSGAKSEPLVRTVNSASAA
jgi:hypothetical protein